jgi:hypothetical protein
LSDAEWLEMTPRQLYALRKRQMEHMQREELLVGILASTSANFSFCRPETPLTPESFMLHPLKTATAEASTPGERLLAVLQALPRGAAKQSVSVAEQGRSDELPV